MSSSLEIRDQQVYEEVISDYLDTVEFLERQVANQEKLITELRRENQDLVKHNQVFTRQIIKQLEAMHATMLVKTIDREETKKAIVEELMNKKRSAMACSDIPPKAGCS